MESERSLPCPQQPVNGGHIILVHITTPRLFTTHFNIEQYYLLGRNVVWFRGNLPTFWRNIMPSSSWSKTQLSMHPEKFVAFLAYFATLTMEAISYPETLVNLYQIT
jgi:hypothetical protein